LDVDVRIATVDNKETRTMNTETFPSLANKVIGKRGVDHAKGVRRGV